MLDDRNNVLGPMLKGPLTWNISIVSHSFFRKSLIDIVPSSKNSSSAMIFFVIIFLSKNEKGNPKYNFCTLAWHTPAPKDTILKLNV